MVGDSLQSGVAAAERCAWSEAFELLSTADRRETLAVDALELLANAAFWTGHYDECVEAYERAYAGHSAAGNKRGAAGAALELAALYNFRGVASVGAGWFYKAVDLLAEEPESPEHGYLAWVQAWVAAYVLKDLDQATAFADEAYAIGRRIKDADIEALGLGMRGTILIERGDLGAGMRLLDQAMASAVGGELGPRATGLTYCSTIATCQYVGDYRRAGEWTDQVKRCSTRPGMTGIPGDCRVHRAGLLRLQGAWVEAEAEATRACVELKEMDFPHQGDAFYEIGEVRLRMGDLKGAEEAFRRSEEYGRGVPFGAQPGMAILWMLQGKLDEATASIKTTVADEALSPLLRVQLLPAAVEIFLASGDVAAARGCAEELARIAKKYQTIAVRAHTLSASGATDLADGKAGDALKSLRVALQLWQEVGATYEAARVRLATGSAYRALGSESDAQHEFDSALAVFESLGAELDRELAARLLGRPPESRPRAQRVARTFMFTDIVGSTELVASLGDDAWCDLLNWHDATLRSLFAEHVGEEIKQIGDGFFVAFINPDAAIQCAIAVQQRLAGHRKANGFAPRVRIGVHGAEATHVSGDFSGRTVNEAARIGALAGADEILVSEKTLGEAGASFKGSAATLMTLKGIPEPVPVVAVDWH